ncbi:hypothetical protein Droror1_Dr00027081 [Drosera rotundifolia]
MIGLLLEMILVSMTVLSTSYSSEGVVGPDELCSSLDSGVAEINVTLAILFVAVASCFLVVLYKLMSDWFIELLVVLFGILDFAYIDVHLMRANFCGLPLVLFLNVLGYKMLI